MSILIKNMEMPTGCGGCPIDSDICTLWQELPPERLRDTRPAACPLVPVSTPHGRCIDADALVDKHFGKEFLSKVMTADEDDLGTALVNIPLVINNAPTIIPAEEGE